jgi:hypothetical protein
LLEDIEFNAHRIGLISSASSAWFKHRTEQLTEARLIVALTVQFSLTAEVTHHTLAAEETADPAAADLADFEL